jgi:endonuclease YncB( thermonuclease family)
MPILLAAAASAFLCAAPTHHDGDNIRCRGQHRSMRLAGIDAPEMPGGCHKGRVCTPGDPYAARDHLISLTRGHRVTCVQVGHDRYRRNIVRCQADGIDLSCAMVADGFAVRRYGPLDCPAD